MSAPHIILDCLPSLSQKLSDLVEDWHSYNKNNFACFFSDTVYNRIMTEFMYQDTRHVSNFSLYINIRPISHIMQKYVSQVFELHSTNCNSFPSSLSGGKIFEMILVLSLGGNTMQTVLHKFTVNCKTASCLASKLMRCWRACHVGAHSTRSSAYANTFITRR